MSAPSEALKSNDFEAYRRWFFGLESGQSEAQTDALLAEHLFVRLVAKNSQLLRLLETHGARVSMRGPIIDEGGEK